MDGLLFFKEKNTLTRYLVSHKNCSIYFDDKHECNKCDDKDWKYSTDKCKRKRMIEEYLVGVVKLLTTVNLNDDWRLFGKHMEIVVEELMNYDDRHKKRR